MCLRKCPCPRKLLPSPEREAMAASRTTKLLSSARTITRLFHLPIITETRRRRGTQICHMSSSANDSWEPLIVDNFEKLLRYGKIPGNYDDSKPQDSDAQTPRHWLVGYPSFRFKFPTEKAMIDYFVKKLAAIVGSEEEAKRKIYLFSSGKGGDFGFGIEVDKQTVHEFEYGGCIREDTPYSTRTKADLRVAGKCFLRNRNHRLDNLFGYHHLSERNPKWNFDHWLVNVKQPYGGFANIPQIAQYCIKILADAVGSERKAIKKIYMYWLKSPYGFAAKIDKETAKKLEDLSDVIEVLPDYAFDVKEVDALFIFPQNTFEAWKKSRVPRRE